MLDFCIMGIFHIIEIPRQKLGQLYEPSHGWRITCSQHKNMNALLALKALSTTKGMLSSLLTLGFFRGNIILMYYVPHLWSLCVVVMPAKYWDNLCYIVYSIVTIIEELFMHSLDFYAPEYIWSWNDWWLVTGRLHSHMLRLELRGANVYTFLRPACVNTQDCDLFLLNFQQQWAWCHAYHPLILVNQRGDASHIMQTSSE
jgi:hypothetical protein